MEAKLVVVGGAARPTEFKLSLPAIVGRSKTADIPIGHSLISRQHCELFEEDGMLKVRDLGSLNGTFVAESRIATDTELPPGAVFTVGPLTFKAVYGEMPPDDPADSSASHSSTDSSVVLPPRASGSFGRPSAENNPAAESSRAKAAKPATAATDLKAAATSEDAATAPQPDEHDEDAAFEADLGWLEESGAAAPGEMATTNFSLNETVDAVSAASDETVEIETVPERDSAAGTGKKPAAAKGFFGRKTVAKAPTAKPVPDKPGKDKPAAAEKKVAKPASAPAANPAAPADVSEEDDTDFLPPPTGKKSDLDNILDFLQ
jgi:pSer/pThr/pTyr-binding forkhead associated (FHA) protein